MKTEKELYPTPSRFYRNHLFKRLARQYFNKDMNFLEIGCGTGEILEFMSLIGLSGIGVDISKEAVKIAKEKQIEGVEVYNKDFFKIEGKFDMVIMMDVLEHLRNDKKAIKKIAQIVKYNGYFILGVPAHMRKFSNADVLFGHYRRYEKEHLYNLLKENDLYPLLFWCYGTSLLRSNDCDKKTKHLRTIDSGIKASPMIKKWHPLISKFYFLLYLQEFILNSDLGDNYIILAKSKFEVKNE